MFIDLREREGVRERGNQLVASHTRQLEIKPSTLLVYGVTPQPAEPPCWGDILCILKA